MNTEFNISRKACFGYLLELPQWGNSNKYPKHMVFYVEKNETRPFLHIILLIKDSSQQICFHGNIFEKEYCHHNEGLLYR